MHASWFHGLPVPILLAFGALLVVIFVPSAIRRNATSKDRAAVLESMGFSQLAREQVFDNPKLLARVIYDNAVTSISDWVGTGQSPFGETVIFDLTHDFSNNVTSRFTVVAFRAARAAADFKISHVLLLERVMRSSNEGDVEPPHMATYDRHSHQWIRPEVDLPVLKRMTFDGNPEFAKNFYVWSSDANATRTDLTPAMIDALVRTKDVNLNVMKRGDWLMIYSWVSSATAPDRYPELVRDAAQLAGYLDLRVRAGP